MATHRITTTSEQDAALAADLADGRMTATAQLQEWIDHLLAGRVAALQRSRLDQPDVRAVAEVFARASNEQKEQALSALGLSEAPREGRTP